MCVVNACERPGVAVQAPPALTLGAGEAAGTAAVCRIRIFWLDAVCRFVLEVEQAASKKSRPAEIPVQVNGIKAIY